MHYEELDDNELMRLTGGGDDDAFSALVVKYQARIVKFCYRYLKDIHLAEDAAQEVFLRVYKYSPKYAPKFGFQCFIYRVATNHCLDKLKYIRRAKRGMPTVSFSVLENAAEEWRSAEDYIPSSGDLPDKNVLLAEEIRSLNDALDELPDRHRDALILFELEDMTYQEIAETMGATLGEVKIWIYRARQSLVKFVRSKHEEL